MCNSFYLQFKFALYKGVNKVLVYTCKMLCYVIMHACKQNMVPQSKESKSRNDIDFTIRKVYIHTYVHVIPIHVRMYIYMFPIHNIGNQNSYIMCACYHICSYTADKG